MAAGHDERGSITQWLEPLKAGDAEAVQAIWERYYERLVRLARARLRRHRRAAAPIVEDEEDAALSAFQSFCDGAAHGRFPRLDDRDDLWRLLVVITARKAGAQLQRQGRQKRGGGGRVVTGTDLAAPVGAGAGNGADSAADVFARCLSEGPTPEFAAIAAEECRRLLDRLDSDDLRRVALDRLDGYTNDEIAARLGCARRTVARRVELIRQIWEPECA